MVSVDTHTAKMTASFSSAPDTLIVNGKLDRHANGGMWSPGGPAIDDAGRIYVTTGNSPLTQAAAPRTWGNSLLRLTRDLDLDAVYTPFDYCALDARDVDVAGSSPILLPPVDGTKTPNLVAFGAKSSELYLVDRDAIAKPGAGRPPCATSFADAAKDGSLLPPDGRAPWCDGFGADPCAAPGAGTTCVRGPLQVFGPPGDAADLDHAKMRTTPAYFRGSDGRSYLFVSGTTKAARCAPDTVPPSVARLVVVRDSTRPAYLALDATDHETSFVNPGSPIVTSDAGRAPVVWVLDPNVRRTQPLLDPANPSPVLYALDGTTMRLLWKSAPADLEQGGKYGTPAVAHGTIFVATDRLHAFVPSP
jgi:hypothetical protein